MQTMIAANARYWLSFLENVPPVEVLQEADLRGAAKALELSAMLPATPWSLVLPLMQNLRPYMERRGYWAEWHTFLHNLIYVAHEQAEIEVETRLLLDLGALYLTRGEYEAMRQTYQRAWHISHETGQTLREAVSLSNLGDYFCMRGDFWRAEVLCQRALALFESLQDTLRQGYASNSLANIYTDQRCWSDALAYYARAEAAFEDCGHSWGMAMVWGNRGRLHSYTREWPQAIAQYEQALAYYEETDNTLWCARTYLNMGYAYVKSLSPACSEPLLLKAETIFEDVGDHLYLARARHNLGMTYTQLEQWEEAERCFTWALEYWRRRDDPWNLANTLGELAELYLRWNQRPRAAVCLDEMADLIRDQKGVAYDTLHRELHTRRARL